jgi:hypothetical protein
MHFLIWLAIVVVVAVGVCLGLLAFCGARFERRLKK